MKHKENIVGFYFILILHRVGHMSQHEENYTNE